MTAPERHAGPGKSAPCKTGPCETGPCETGLYVHWPFCLSRCPYCDFNSHVRASIDQDRWRNALLAEMDWQAAETSGRRLSSIFIGGGTPSLMDAATVAAIIDRAARHWSFADDIEISLEANPGAVDAERFAGFRLAGINRLSIGVQALDDDALRQLGRRHDLATALDAITVARNLFPRMSFDLIYARPGQTAKAWLAELARALDLAADHLSLYQLTLERGTPFYAAWQRGELAPLGEEDAASLFETTQAALADAGLPAYEISNHARPGAECRHNLIYWRSGDCIPIGPGAHGRLTAGNQRRAIHRIRLPEAWLTAVERDGHATRESTVLSEAERLDEFMLMGLRLTEGIHRGAFRAALGGEIEDRVARARIDALAAEGLLECDAAGLRLTAAGRQRLNAVLAWLLT
ncbi:MAG: radical SAM family heme chaperone HemW [Alphaproteobacteria bacterium]